MLMWMWIQSWYCQMLSHLTKRNCNRNNENRHIVEFVCYFLCYVHIYIWICSLYRTAGSVTILCTDAPSNSVCKFSSSSCGWQHTASQSRCKNGGGGTKNKYLIKQQRHWILKQLHNFGVNSNMLEYSSEHLLCSTEERNNMTVSKWWPNLFSFQIMFTQCFETYS